jgi:hypothetical protein
LTSGPRWISVSRHCRNCSSCQSKIKFNPNLDVNVSSQLNQCVQTLLNQLPFSNQKSNLTITLTRMTAPSWISVSRQCCNCSFFQSKIKFNPTLTSGPRWISVSNQVLDETVPIKYKIVLTLTLTWMSAPSWISVSRHCWNCSSFRESKSNIK